MSGLTVTGRRCKRLFGLHGSTLVLFHDGVLFMIFAREDLKDKTTHKIKTLSIMECGVYLFVPKYQMVGFNFHVEVSCPILTTTINVLYALINKTSPSNHDIEQEDPRQMDKTNVAYKENLGLVIFFRISFFSSL
ncbi:hypothetical protein HanPSC8_Chr16g0719551 [Helianthus annuus]|nr:hypothetical protein HanPSC8_Chr16g0719551 [Helianthus annuus]